MRNKLIKQEDEFGCGIACVANLLKITYRQSLGLFSCGISKAKNRGFLCSEICELLNKRNKSFDYKYIKSKLRSRIYKSGTIIFIKISKKYPSGHYLLRANDGWIDPWANFLKDGNIKRAKAGIRKRLPGKAIYFIQES